MGYCAASDVESEFKNTTFGVDTNVTLDDVNAFIAETSSLIDSYVAKRYVLPIDSGLDSYNVLKMLCRVMVAERVRGIMEVKQSTNTDANQIVKRPYDMKNAYAQLERIADGSQALIGASLIASSGALFSQNVKDKVCAVFKKDKVQW